MNGTNLLSKEFIARMNELFPQLVKDCTMDELESIIGAVRHEQAHRLMRAFHSAPSCLPLASASPFEPPEWLIRAIETGDGIILDEIDVPKYNPPRDIPINSSISGVKGKKR